MKSSYNSQTPKTVGVVVITAVMIIGIYTLILKNSDQNTPSTKVTSTSNTSANVVSVTTATPNPTTSPTPATVMSTAPADSTPTAIPAATVSPTSTPLPTPTVAVSGYKDGTYKVTNSYNVPRNGTNSVAVTITVKTGVIAAVQVADDYSDGESDRYVKSFESSISGQIVGQKIDQASVYRVGGASLTSQAFNTALSQVVSAAKA